jgi:hypothetical protein
MNSKYLSEICIELVNPPPLYEKELGTSSSFYPIPYFGEIESADVITVGVNPAASEFDLKRKWPCGLSVEALNRRLLGYFRLEFPPPHQWFTTWEIALNQIEISYYTKQAAHLDLSPRVTKNMSDIANPDLFLEMLNIDLKWFFQSLALCKNVKLLMIAGAVTNRYYINEFIQEHAKEFGFSFTGIFSRKNNHPKGKICFHRLKGNNIDLPVFFCSVSPSARNSNLLIERVAENQHSLVNLLRVKE